MRKRLSVILAMVLALSLALVGWGNDTVIKESEQVSAETSGTEESSTESSVEDTIEASTEETSEDPTEEENIDVEAEVAKIAEELSLDDELSAMLLEELQWVYEYYADDEEMLTEIVEGLKIEFAEMAEAKAYPETEKPELWNIRIKR